MNRSCNITALILLFIFTGCGRAVLSEDLPIEGKDPAQQQPSTVAAKGPDTPDGTEKTGSRLDGLLDALGKKTDTIQSLQAQIQYTFVQNPELMDAVTIRRGVFYYRKNGQRSILRVNFDTLKQDEADEEKRSEHFVFDGVWLTKVDYQMEKVDLYQQATEDKPLDVFEFVSHNFPMIGFIKPENIRKNFELSIVDAQEDKQADKKPQGDGNTEANKNLVRVHLVVKEDSEYRKDYKSVDFWLDQKRLIPVRVEAISTEDDVYKVLFVDMVENREIKDSVFRIQTPKNFSCQKHPLDEKTGPAGNT